MDIQPIGILDSGVGGLTVWKEIVAALPHESTVYIGDSFNAPYGTKTQAEIIQLAKHMIRFLKEKQVKLIVVACNTITVSGIDRLREAFPDIPVVGTVPVVKMAAALTKKKKIGLLATGATGNSAYNQKLIKDFAADCEVVVVGTNILVPLIENNKKEELKKILPEILKPFREVGVDVVVLGCTHFPLIRKDIEVFLGEGVSVIDSGGAIARQVRRILTSNNALNSGEKISHQLFTTGKIRPFEHVVELLHSYKDNITVKQWQNDRDTMSV